jgi:uncharacterized damage-inducible protein DinB
MTTTTQTRELLLEVARARQDVARAVSNASRDWEDSPGAGEWSVRRIAEHVIENDYFFAGELARILQLPRPSVGSIALSTPGAAIDALATAEWEGRVVLGAVSDDQLGREWQGGMSIGDLLAFYAAHTREHVEQLEATRGTLALAPSAS